VQIVPNPGQVIRVEGDDGELYGADWANLSQPIELISNQGRWNPLGYQLQLAIRGMVFDVWSGSPNGQPQNFTDVNGTIYFVADNGVDGIELWKTDGTAAGTSQVKDFNSGSGHGLGNYGDVF
jgi:ELWxxDGT repeat protein